ncbi:MAG: FAD:protein FMN transferase [Propionibacteriales bacterium]|nr:FAD:protein FMN transferase [Propionibacteriales bacterium]
MTLAPSWTEFRALGTYVHLQTTGDPAHAEMRAAEILDAVDAACSRFRVDSDLSRANAAAGTRVAVSDLFRAALRVALDVAEVTEGILDPGLGRNLVELGYDVDLEQVRQRRDLAAVVGAEPSRGRWKSIELDGGSVRVPRGVALDLGATAKAWAADLVAKSLMEETGEAVLVSLGGDVSIAGPRDEARSWAIDITEHPGGATQDVAPAPVWLDAGGLATSSTEVRRWRAGGVERHHLIDPRTGLSTQGPWRTATATGPTCVAANAAATAALVLGDDAVDWLEARGVSARLVSGDGQVHLVGQWPAPARSGAL